MSNLSALAGYKIPGGCDQCDAYQTVTGDSAHQNVHHIRVHHDDDCPFLVAYNRRTRSA